MVADQEWRVLTTDSEGNVYESLLFDIGKRAEYAAILERAGFAPSDLWNLSPATLAMMVRDIS